MKRPAFQFYVQDFITGTLFFSAEETGAYIRLLCYQWDKGFVPNDEKILQKITGTKKKCVENILSKFSKTEDGHYINQKLEKVRITQEEYVKKQQANGAKGGRPRVSQEEPKNNPTVNPNETSSSSTSSSTSKEVVDVRVTDPFFAAFRRCAGSHINNEVLFLEVGAFKNKYPNHHLNRCGGLINAWVANIGKEKPKVKDNNSFV